MSSDAIREEFMDKLIHEKKYDRKVAFDKSAKSATSEYSKRLQNLIK